MKKTELREIPVIPQKSSNVFANPQLKNYRLAFLALIFAAMMKSFRVSPPAG